jgi:hypothetical protein
MFLEAVALIILNREGVKNLEWVEKVTKSVK